MITQARVIVTDVIGACAVALLSTFLFSQQHAQSTNASSQKPQFATEVRHIGNAEVKTVIDIGYFPSRQPTIYWHDQDYRIDLVIPPTDAKDDAYLLRVRSSSGTESSLRIPEVYGQVNKIIRNPDDKVVLQADCGGTCTGFLVVDLKLGKVIDDIGSEDITISPNGRFVFYDNGYPSHSEEDPHLYHLYDTTKSPKDNFCGHSQSSSVSENLPEDWRGFQVFPQKPGQIYCTVVENDGFDEDHQASDFTWSEDSSKIAFADIKNGKMSLILVTMPVGRTDLPKTSVYPLQGTQDECAGATAADGETNCDTHVIQSLGWDGDSVKASFHHQFGTPLDLQLTIPVSSFVEIGK